MQIQALTYIDTQINVAILNFSFKANNWFPHCGEYRKTTKVPKERVCIRKTSYGKHAWISATYFLTTEKNHQRKVCISFHKNGCYFPQSYIFSLIYLFFCALSLHFWFYLQEQFIQFFMEIITTIYNILSIFAS